MQTVVVVRSENGQDGKILGVMILYGVQERGYLVCFYMLRRLYGGSSIQVGRMNEFGRGNRKDMCKVVEIVCIKVWSFQKLLRVIYLAQFIFGCLVVFRFVIVLGLESSSIGLVLREITDWIRGGKSVVVQGGQRLFFGVSMFLFVKWVILIILIFRVLLGVNVLIFIMYL